jgi:hypothetical protein
MPIILGPEIGRILVQGQIGQIVLQTPSPEIIRAKWTGGEAQTVEQLLCKHKVLNSNPSPTKIKKKCVDQIPNTPISQSAKEKK